MERHVFQLRRGIRRVDENGATLLNEDGTAVRDDWAAYTASPGHVNPLECELVVEYEVYPNNKKVPRLKIGDGVSEFKDLEYISVDSFILPKPALIHLSTDWQQDEGVDDRYYQVVTVQNAVVTPNSKIDILPTAEQLSIFHAKDLAFVAENEDGVVRVYCVGLVPQNAYDLNATVTEVVIDG